jgi:hypothetical protein
LLYFDYVQFIRRIDDVVLKGNFGAKSNQTTQHVSEVESGDLCHNSHNLRTITANEGTMKASLVTLVLTAMFGCSDAFQASTSNRVASSSSSTSTALFMANEGDFMRWAKASRSASAEDNKVEMLRPLGLVLNQDDAGNVYVETVAPKGNAARTGKVRPDVCVCVCIVLFLYVECSLDLASPIPSFILYVSIGVGQGR